LGDNFGGNNTAEAATMKDCLEWIKGHFDLQKHHKINVVGDNHLCIQFMRGQAKPKLKQLVILVG
jgi:ribonuclease HI